MILAGDIGGTKTVLALFDEAPTGLDLRHEETFASKGAATLEALALRFLDGCHRPPVRAACLGVAGAVVAGHVKATNLPWEIDEASLGATLGIPRVRLLNDLEAAAHGVLSAPAETFLTLQTGLNREQPATMVLIAAGTGLGEAIIPWDGTRHHVLASEGGHVDFAPRSELEAQLWEFLRREYGHVSYERVLSGPGFFNVYRFLRFHRKLEEPAWLTAQIAAGDPTASVSQAALAKLDPVCVEALSLCVTIYGAEAGNLALKALAVGGVYVGGGIAPKILELFREGPFMAGFLGKGRLTDLMRTIPVHLVRDPRAPLLGAASVGARL